MTEIACGSGHTVILSGNSTFMSTCCAFCLRVTVPLLADDGELYTWGRGDDGRLGRLRAFSVLPACVQCCLFVELLQVTGIRVGNTSPSLCLP